MWLNNRLNSNLLASCVVKYVHINILMYNMLEDSMSCEMCYVCYVGSSFLLLVPFSVRVFKGPLHAAWTNPQLCNCDVLCTACSSWVEFIHCCTGGALWREGALDLKTHVKIQNFRISIFLSSDCGRLDILQVEFWELLVVSWPPASKSPLVRMNHDGTAVKSHKSFEGPYCLSKSVCSLCRGIVWPDYTSTAVMRMRCNLNDNHATWCLTPDIPHCRLLLLYKVMKLQHVTALQRRVFGLHVRRISEWFLLRSLCQQKV